MEENVNMQAMPTKMYKLDVSKIDSFEAVQAVFEGLNMHMTQFQYDGASEELKAYFSEVVPEEPATEEPAD